ncbi:MAG TPA: citrate synthase [Egibacteraceae bacterium]|nr:citrate synthase [Actinomycetota bacterium]HWB73068.1 citrate synthase [Egibacteraceae bacterium]
MKARIEYDGHAFEAPLVVGSENEKAVDISKLRGSTGLITYDPGYANTGAAKSAITYIDGEQGVLRYRGYPIEQLAAHSDFIETSYLLIYGELPTQQQLQEFRYHIVHHTLLHEDLRRFFDAFRRDAHPMGILVSATSALSTFYQDHYDPFDPYDVEVTIHRLMAKLPTVTAFAYKRSLGQPYVYPQNRLDFAENFLHMMFAVPAERYEVDADMARALDLLFLLHADHEQNCSASTVRLVGSSQVNLYACVAAGISALWGPLHGGANQRVVEMLEQIRDAAGDTQSFVKRAKDRSDPFRLSGFGHRVYKNYDPRARIIKEAADRVVHNFVGDDPLMEIAVELEQTVLHDDYFIERRLYPNVDFYSGLIYRALGLPLTMFPALFALGRLPGWIAQWKEMIEDTETRIGRPRQIYIGANERDYVPIERR